MSTFDTSGIDIQEWVNLNYAQKQRLIRELLDSPKTASTITYRNSTGRLFLQDGEIMGEWQSTRTLIDAFNIKYVAFKTVAYCKQGYIFFYKDGQVVKTLTRQLLDVKDPLAVVVSTIRKQTKLDFDDVAVIALPYKDLKWQP